jgi:hypothetical protein
MARVEHIHLLGKFPTHDAGVRVLKQPGDAVLIERGVPRLLLLQCPCGCGDNLTINLDRRVGPAWRHYLRGENLSLYPSYWRDSHCGSHFILWNNQVYWCDWDDDRYWRGTAHLESQVWTALTSDFINYETLADQLGEIPWDVLQACYALVRGGRAVQHPDRRAGAFRRSSGR